MIPNHRTTLFRWTRCFVVVGTSDGRPFFIHIYMGTKTNPGGSHSFRRGCLTQLRIREQEKSSVLCVFFGVLVFFNLTFLCFNAHPPLKGGCD